MRYGLKEGHLVYAKFIHRSAQGDVLWHSDWIPNHLANEGEQLLLDVFLRGAAGPSSFRVRLFADVPVETDSLASLSGEPGGNTGYVPGTINRDATAAGWPTLENVGGDYEARGAKHTFRCTGPGSYGVMKYAVLATTSDNSGKLVDYTLLKDPRSMRSGDTLDVIYAPSLS